MPIIKDEEQLKQYDNSAVKNNILFRERLMDRFKPSDFVRVINVDDEDFIWQYASPADEEITSDGIHRFVNRQRPQTWIISPGDTEVLQGDNAYVMIESLYKKVSAKKIIARTPNQASVMARNFNWSDPVSQEEFINKVYLGKENPIFGKGESNAEPRGTSGTTPATKPQNK